MIEQLVTAPCVIAQIDQIREHLLDPTKAAQPLPRWETLVGPVVIRAPNRSFTLGAWQAAISEGTISHMDSRRQREMANLYAGQEKLDRTMQETESLRARLTVLADAIEPTEANKFAVLQSLAELRMKTGLQQLMGVQLLDATRDAELLPAEGNLEELAEFVERPGGTFDFCKEHGWPLGNWREQLAAQAQLPDD